MDLDHVAINFGLWLDDCLLEAGLSAQHAQLQTIRLRRCHLGAWIGPAFHATGLHVSGQLVIAESSILSEEELGAIYLSDCRVDGEIRLNDTLVDNSGGPALVADGLRTQSSLFLNRLAVRGSADEGMIRAHDAEIRGQLNFSGARLRNETGPVINVDNMRIGGDVLLTDGFTGEGWGELGAVRFPGAWIKGALWIREATIRNSSGPALGADGLKVDGPVQIDRGSTIEGVGELGAVRLRSAKIGSQIRIREAEFTNPTGPALEVSGIDVAGDFLVRDAVLDGGGTAGTVRMIEASIGAQLLLAHVAIKSSAGPAFLAARTQVKTAAFFDEGVSAVGAGASGVVQLSGVHVDGRLRLTPDEVRNISHPRSLWEIDGLKYSGVPRLAEGGHRAWLSLIGSQTPKYTAQPYQHLANTYRAEGHDSEVREILIAQRRDQIARGTLKRSEKFWARTTGLLVGYGYKPWRALLYLAGILTISVALNLTLGEIGGLARTSTQASGSIAVPCTAIQTIGRGLDLGTPFVPIAPVVAGSCQPTISPPGDVLTISRWVLQLAAWALAAIFIAGFTSVVRIK